MEFTASHFFWCRNCGAKLRARVALSSEAVGCTSDGNEVEFSHIMPRHDTHAPVPSFIPPMVAGDFRTTQ